MNMYMSFDRSYLLDWMGFLIIISVENSILEATDFAFSPSLFHLRLVARSAYIFLCTYS